MAGAVLDEALAETVNASWNRFIDLAEPLRPELFRFCLRLTGSAFDAEDLVQEGLVRAFPTMGKANGNIRNPRAFMFRVVTNLWIDELRRARPENAGGEEELVADAGVPPDRQAELPGATEHALAVLTPRERAAVVLKEAFDMPHAEIADVLSVSEGAVKVALHRGRRRLADARERPPRRSHVSRELVERFVEAFRMHDLEAVKTLLLESVEADNFPSGMGVGREHAVERGWVRGSFYHHVADYEARGEPYPKRFEIVEIENEPVILVFRDHGRGEALEEFWRLEEEAGRVARIRDYCFCPDIVRWVGEMLALPTRPIGYRTRPNMHEFPDEPSSNST